MNAPATETPPEPFPPFRPSERPEARAELEYLQSRGEHNAQLIYYLALGLPFGLLVLSAFGPRNMLCAVLLLLGVCVWAAAGIAGVLLFVQSKLTGEPPIVYFDPRLRLRATGPEEDFYTTLRGRPALEGTEYYRAFYLGTAVPPEWPRRALAAIEDALGWEACELASLHPRDELVYF
ncbi:MAG: hypothetical protein AAF907_13970, partial [Planctomycetota bacterium]